MNSGRVARTPNTSNIVFECIEGEALVIALDLKGISVSTGAACSSGAVEPSHVLTAMGLTSGEARASIRFSLGKQTSEDDLAFVLDQVAGDRRQTEGAEPGVERIESAAIGRRLSLNRK